MTLCINSEELSKKSVVTFKRTTHDKLNIFPSIGLNKHIMAQYKGKERENSYKKLKRSPEERHTQTHGNLFEIFRWSQTSFSVRRE